MRYIGIDPGASGGIAMIDDRSAEFVLAWKMPATDCDILALLENVIFYDGQRGVVHAVIEKVNPGVFGRPGAKMGVVSAFTFGGGYRALKMALAACRIPYDEALPMKWQTAMQCRSKGDKNITKARAQALFPQIKVTHAIADALLIAEFCRRLHSGAAPARPAQKGLFDGEKKGREEDDAIQFGVGVWNENHQEAERRARPDATHAGRHAATLPHDDEEGGITYGAEASTPVGAARSRRSRHRRH